MQFWPLPNERLAHAIWAFGRRFLSVWANGLSSLSERLGLPPNNQQPATTSATISVTSICTVTRPKRRAVTDRRIDGWSMKSGCAAYGQRCEVRA